MPQARAAQPLSGVRRSLGSLPGGLVTTILVCTRRAKFLASSFSRERSGGVCSNLAEATQRLH
jgi:hypothetical protein